MMSLSVFNTPASFSEESRREDFSEEWSSPEAKITRLFRRSDSSISNGYSSMFCCHLSKFSFIDGSCRSWGVIYWNLSPASWAKTSASSGVFSCLTRDNAAREAFPASVHLWSWEIQALYLFLFVKLVALRVRVICRKVSWKFPYIRSVYILRIKSILLRKGSKSKLQFFRIVAAHNWTPLVSQSYSFFFHSFSSFLISSCLQVWHVPGS